MRTINGYKVPDIAEIKAWQAETTRQRMELGNHAYCAYFPISGEFIIEADPTKTYHYDTYCTYLPPWEDPHTIRTAILNWVLNRKDNSYE